MKKTMGGGNRLNVDHCTDCQDRKQYRNSSLGPQRARALEQAFEVILLLVTGARMYIYICIFEYNVYIYIHILRYLKGKYDIFSSNDGSDDTKQIIMIMINSKRREIEHLVLYIYFTRIWFILVSWSM